MVYCLIHPKQIVVDCYADANFAGLWGHENPQDPIVILVELDLWQLLTIFLYCGCQNYI